MEQGLIDLPQASISRKSCLRGHRTSSSLVGSSKSVAFPQSVIALLSDECGQCLPNSEIHPTTDSELRDCEPSLRSSLDLAYAITQAQQLRSEVADTHDTLIVPVVWDDSMFYYFPPRNRRKLYYKWGMPDGLAIAKAKSQFETHLRAAARYPGTRVYHLGRHA